MESDQTPSESDGVRQSSIGLQWSPTDSDENNNINVVLLHHINNYLFNFLLRGRGRGSGVGVVVIPDTSSLPPTRRRCPQHVVVAPDTSSLPPTRHRCPRHVVVAPDTSSSSGSY